MSSRLRPVVWLIAVALAACGAPAPATQAPGSSASPGQPTPGATEPVSATATATATSGESYPPQDPRSLPDSLWTSQVDPIVLTARAEDDRSATATIGSEGGTVEATGADGTKYTLTIPAAALALPVDVTMAPIAALDGFPAEITPDHVLGVSLGPEGLELGLPASLAIEPQAGLPVAGVYGFDFRGMSSAAGFHLLDRSGSKLTMQIDHFSNYASVFPIDDIPWHLRDQFLAGRGRTLEEELDAEVAYFLGLLRQQELLGAEETYSKVEIARATLSAYKRLIIGPRVAVADKSCANANAAMAAYIQYQRGRQLLGVIDDPEFDLWELGGGMLVPADLLEIAVSVCFREAYERCVRTGDWPSMAAYFYSLLTRFQNLVGGDPSPTAIAQGQDYLQRCGRWRVKIDTTHDLPEGVTFTEHNNALREFFVQWQPGSGDLGLLGSHIEGTGPVEALSISFIGACTATITNIQSRLDARAEITHLAFDHYEGPTQTGEPLAPVPTKLTLLVHLGFQFHHEKCPNGADIDRDENFMYVYELIGDKQQHPINYLDLVDIDAGLGGVQIDKDWQFRTSPYKATNVMDGPALIGYDENHVAINAQVHVEVTVEHEPQ